MTHSDNERLLTLISEYLTFTPTAISPKDVSALARDCNIPPVEAYLALLAAHLGLDTANPEDARLYRGYLPRMVHPHDPAVYEADAYFRTVKPWNKHYQQLWCDTLFMVCLFLAKAGMVLDHPEWIDEAEYQFLLHIRYLQDKVSGLFDHGWTFDCRHNYASAKWARGNAWFTAAAIELKDITGRYNAAMRMILSAWEDQVLALWKYQRVNGSFTTLINVEETYCETSATAAIAYGVLKGLRLGLLSGERYEEMARLATQAVLAQIDDTGAVQGVSGGTGMGYTLQHYKDIIVTPTAYGQGLTFLMLTELMRNDAAPLA